MLDKREIFQDKILGTNKRINIMGVNIDSLDEEQTIELVNSYIKTKTPLHLIGVNADKLNEAKQNEYMQNIINGCGIINADGASVVLASKYLDKQLPERVAGIDLMMGLIQYGETEGRTIYLLGATDVVVKETANKIRIKHPAINIVGIRNGYFSKDEWVQVSEEIKRLEPEIVFVGITSPIKEYLVEYLQHEGHKSVFMGVGGSFDVISGELKRAPLWLQKMNLEWLYRVIQEPRRLFKRYFIGNIKFINEIIKEKKRYN